jgi:TPR repeat protein
MGMAHLMGQLGLPAQPELGLPLILRAATLASVQVPQPAYVYGLLLLGEFAHVTVPPQCFAPFIPQHSSAEQEARLHLERAAFLHFAPAQYKLGHAYEFALPPFPFDALLSVQYYSLASQQGEVEADMALSKWFLCGAEGAFDKDENLAFTFAEKAARKGLPSAEFAMGYYKEVGVGGNKDIEAAQMWYQLVSRADVLGRVLIEAMAGFGSWQRRRGGTAGSAIPALPTIPLPTGTRHDHGIQAHAETDAGETALGARGQHVARVARGRP